jgi:hypothetical protein
MSAKRITRRPGLSADAREELERISDGKLGDLEPGLMEAWSGVMFACRYDPYLVAVLHLVSGRDFLTGQDLDEIPEDEIHTLDVFSRRMLAAKNIFVNATEWALLDYDEEFFRQTADLIAIVRAGDADPSWHLPPPDTENSTAREVYVAYFKALHALSLVPLDADTLVLPSATDVYDVLFAERGWNKRGLANPHDSVMKACARAGLDLA